MKQNNVLKDVERMCRKFNIGKINKPVVFRNGYFGYPQDDLSEDDKEDKAKLAKMKRRSKIMERVNEKGM